MKLFIDNKGREWILEIHIAAVKRARDILGVNIYKLVDDGLKGLGDLLSDPIQLVDLIFVLCKDQADRQGVTDYDFGSGLYGDAIESARNAFLEELTDFFPDPRVRNGILNVIRAATTVRDRVVNHWAQNLDQIDLEAAVQDLISRSRSGDSRDLSGSTPVT